MTTNRPEFKAHDDFIFKHKKVGKVTREEFIQYIRSSHEHMRKLSEIIQQYNQTIDEYLNEWDGRFESFDEDVKDLLHLWIQDGTMNHIINENLMSTKADKEYVDDEFENVTAQLAQTVATEAKFMEGSTDSEKIQNAIDLSQTLGNKTVIVSDKEGGWTVTRAIEIPSNTTFIINNTTIKLGQGVQDNIITNSGARTTPLSSNENIHIVGIGKAVLDGQGNVHKNFETGKGGHKRVALLLFNTQNFSITKLKVSNPHGWSISMENGCENGLVRDIEFYGNFARANQDGIDLRRGCRNITIENISGVTGDDMIALTTLNNGTGERDPISMQVGSGVETYGINNNIENVIIRNVKGYSSGRHNLIRLLCKDGNQIKNIKISDIEDTSKPDDSKGSSVVLIGSDSYSTISHDALGDMSDIEINNVTARGNVDVIKFESHTQNLEMSNIKYLGHNSVNLIRFVYDNKEYKNLIIKDLSIINDEIVSNSSPQLVYLGDSTYTDVLIDGIYVKNVRYVILNKTSATNLVSNLNVRNVIIDGTWLVALRLDGNYSTENPASIKNVAVKDFEKINLSSQSTNYTANLFRLGSNVLLEDIKYPLSLSTFVTLRNVGEGTVFTPSASFVGMDGFNTVDSSIVYKVVNNRKFLQFRLSLKSDGTDIYSYGRNIGAFPSALLETTQRTLCLGYVGNKQFTFTATFKNDGYVELIPHSDVDVENITDVVIDAEFYVGDLMDY